MDMRNKVLPEFQRYLRSKSLAKEKNITFYAHWASKFVSFVRGNGHLSRDLQVQMFLDDLTAQTNISDWQVRQADNAVQLYVNQFLDSNESLSPTAHSEETKNLSVSSKIIEEMRQALRIKHYACQTELTYLEWAKKFFDYTTAVKKKSIHTALDSVDVRDYLTHLALKKKVAASTQNQAFNALIFLFRYVLKIELRDLNKAVRAKRGQKLPVVFTVNDRRGERPYAPTAPLLPVGRLCGISCSALQAVHQKTFLSVHQYCAIERPPGPPRPLPCRGERRRAAQ